MIIGFCLVFAAAPSIPAFPTPPAFNGAQPGLQRKVGGNLECRNKNSQP